MSSQAIYYYTDLPNGVINLKNNTLMSNFDNAIFKYIENENKIVPIM